jgi:DNA-binding NarL/FixJ family response regulator
LLVGDGREWPPELEACLAREGYATDRRSELEATFPLLESGSVRALLVLARPLGASDLLTLGRVRQTSPGTAIVVITTTPTHPDLKRAFESGATAFLSWPASKEALRQAVDSGGMSAPIEDPLTAVKAPKKDPPVSTRLKPAIAGESSSRHEAQVTLQNRLPPKHPQRHALEAAIRGALGGLSGSWDVVLEKPGGLSLVIAVVAPDGAAWTMSCCNAAHRDPESIAEIVRAACSRRRWLDPSASASGHPQDDAEPLGTPVGLTTPGPAESAAPIPGDKRA